MQWRYVIIEGDTDNTWVIESPLVESNVISYILSSLVKTTLLSPYWHIKDFEYPVYNPPDTVNWLVDKIDESDLYFISVPIFVKAIEEKSVWPSIFVVITSPPSVSIVKPIDAE